MKTLTLQWFNQPEILVPIGRGPLAKLFSRFRDDLAYPCIYPPSAESQTPHYFNQVATMLKGSENWPASFEEALLAIEEMASPQMEARREALMAAAPPELEIDRASPPQRLAIQLWLHS